MDDAVRDAQARGFAEAIPDRDLDGLDAADKIAILAWLAFGVAPHMLLVQRRPLDDAVALAPVAAALGCATRQLAEVVLTSAGLVASVEPALVSRSHALGRTEDEWNTVSIESASAGTIVLSGPGAGGDATAGALYADIGHGSAPLPLPTVARVAARDERQLAWIVLTRAGDAVVLGAGGERCRAEGSALGGAAMHVLVATRDEVATLCGQLRATGEAPAFARDLR